MRSWCVRYVSEWESRTSGATAPSRLLLPGEDCCIRYSHAGAPESCGRRDYAERRRIRYGAAGERCRQQREHSFCVREPDRGGCAFRIAGRGGHCPGHRSRKRRFFADDWRADLRRFGHGSVTAAARRGAGHSYWGGSGQPHPSARGCRRWSYAGERGDDRLEREQWLAVLGVQRSVFLLGAER